jgi:hypothetical protein
MKDSDDSYIFKTAELIEWQKWLNQWKHKYNLEIINTFYNSENGRLTILLKRTLK